MRFIEVSLVEPEKHVVAMADAYFFPPYQHSLYTPPKGKPLPQMHLPKRQAEVVVYNKISNETTVWKVELTEVHAVTRGGHVKGKVLHCDVIPDVQPPMVQSEAHASRNWICAEHFRNQALNALKALRLCLANTFLCRVICFCSCNQLEELWELSKGKILFTQS